VTKSGAKKSAKRASLLRALRLSTTERPVHRWLKKHPIVVSQFVGGFSFATKVVSQFKFGTDHVADFVAIGSYSGGCCVHFVELEPPGARLFTNAGVPAARLSGAITQILDWRRFIDTNRETVLREISKCMKARELVSNLGSDIFDNTGKPIWDPRVSIQWYYHILIGRRGELSDEAMQKKASYPEINIATYDRVLDYADSGRMPETKHVVTAIVDAKTAARFQKLLKK
jgi:hypothetical protein